MKNLETLTNEELKAVNGGLVWPTFPTLPIIPIYPTWPIIPILF